MCRLWSLQPVGGEADKPWTHAATQRCIEGHEDGIAGTISCRQRHVAFAYRDEFLRLCADIDAWWSDEALNSMALASMGDGAIHYQAHGDWTSS